jgi:hypothetical protein
MAPIGMLHELLVFCASTCPSTPAQPVTCALAEQGASVWSVDRTRRTVRTGTRDPFCAR